MGIKDLFKKRRENSPAEELYKAAKQKADSGNAQDALQTLIRAFHEDVDYKPLYKLAADCLATLGGERENILFEHAYHNFNSAESFSKLGSHFSGTGDYYLSQAFLQKALSMEPGNIDAAHDLAIAYARRFNIAKAIEALESVNARKDFWALWFLAKCRILNKEIGKAREDITELESALEGHPNPEEIEIPQLKIEELKEMIRRYKTIEEPKEHIRHWQFIQYGGVVLDYFDEDEDQRSVAGGRYVASWGSNEGLKNLIDTFKSFAAYLPVSFGSVKYLADRNSEIVGKTIAKIFNLRADRFNPDDENYHCLIVAGDSESLNEFELNVVENGQVVFALNHSWLQSAYLTPDIIGFMTQSYYFPWNGEGIKVIDAEAGKIERTEPDNRSADEIAEEIASLAFEPQNKSALFEFYKERREHLKGIGSQAGNQRYNFMIESPVPGSYFGV